MKNVQHRVSFFKPLHPSIIAAINQIDRVPKIELDKQVTCRKQTTKQNKTTTSSVTSNSKPLPHPGVNFLFRRTGAKHIANSPSRFCLLLSRCCRRTVTKYLDKHNPTECNSLFVKQQRNLQRLFMTITIKYNNCKNYKKSY